ncbi:MAG: LLM class flavin-dependent oxidoreductase [Candidatus Hermodarchaeota archaeon]|nr:LLM class flavin-dependent oxidoreductase [Candidatus Hermodarchaeota archaeon]
MNYGVQIEPQFGFGFVDITRIADAALKNGFSTLWFSDHFMLDESATDRVLLEPWLLMTALTQRNSRIRVGSMVFCQSYRNPALVAKMAATLDVLSQGRLVFGLGAGWKELEYNAYGYPFPEGKIRINQLAEAVQIIRGIWTNDRFTFKGKHYQVNDVISYPKPLQQPMPILIGAQEGREPMLRLTARYGDAINIAWMSTPETLRRQIQRLTQLCNKYSRDVDDIHLSIGLWTRHFRSEEDRDAAIVQGAKDRKISPDNYRKRIDQTLWGTTAQIVSRLQEFQELGVADMVFMFPHENEVEHINTLGTEILPRV